MLSHTHLPTDALFEKFTETILASKHSSVLPIVAMTGGSTPKAWFQWVVARSQNYAESLKGIVWTVSDERFVQIGHADSNYGTMARLMLDPLALPILNRIPWPVDLPPQDATQTYAARFDGRGISTPLYDICVVGMGDDGHTLSIFPNSPLLKEDAGASFTSIEVPGKGQRLTLTPSGLAQCGKIVLIVTGAAKASILKDVLYGPPDEARLPAQILRRHTDKLIVFADEAASSHLPDPQSA